jgi:protein TonB
MSIAAATIRMRPARGPALGKARLPFAATVVSTILHVALGVAVVLTARAWSQSQPKIYVVNLVPAVAAVGSPQGQTTPTLPPRPAELPRPEPARPVELPQRDAARPTTAPEMPPRAQDAPSLPDRSSSAPRPSATPRAGDKELPSMATPTPASKPSPERVPTETVARATPPPPQPIGRADGSPQGAGALTLNVSDFKFAWYIRTVGAKITDKWAGRALPGQQPVATFDITRDGRISGLAIKKSSGNSYYDQAALRAIIEAAPFPPLPSDFDGPVLGVELGFHFPERG